MISCLNSSKIGNCRRESGKGLILILNVLCGLILPPTQAWHCLHTWIPQPAYFWVAFRKWIYIGKQPFFYKSRPILLTILYSSLEFPASFVSEYMRLQPLLRVKLEKQNFMKNSNLRPDSCFEGFFNILLGFFVAVIACVNDRLHGVQKLGWN